MTDTEINKIYLDLLRLKREIRQVDPDDIQGAIVLNGALRWMIHKMSERPFLYRPAHWNMDHRRT